MEQGGGRSRPLPFLFGGKLAGGMRPLASAPLAAPLPRHSGVEPFWNSLGHDLAIVVPRSVPAFLLRMPGGDPAAPANVRSWPQATCGSDFVSLFARYASRATRRGHGLVSREVRTLR